MATILYWVGRWSFRRRRLVAGLWLGAVVVAVVAGATAPAGEEEDISMPGTESQQAFDLLDERFPQSNSQGAEARLVFQAPDGQRVTADEYQAAVEDAIGSLDGGDQVAGVADPYEEGTVSDDGTIAYSTITYTEAAVDLTGSTKSALEDAADDARDAGMTVEIGGSALDAEVSPGGTTEMIGVAIAAVVLILTLGSMVAAGLSLLSAFTGVAIAFGLVSALSVPLGLTSTVAILALMLGLAVGIDYALFITSRYREERARGSEPEEAAGRAVGTAGSAVVFAGATVVIALVGLGVVGIPELTKIGVGGAGAVALAVLVALTLVPALLGLFGRRVLSRKVRKGKRPSGRSGLGTRWARFVLRRPVAVLMVAGIGLGAVAVPALSLELGLPGDESKPVETTQRRAYDLLSEGFGPGFNGPLTVVADLSKSPDSEAATARVVETLEGVDGVASVDDPVLNEAEDTAVLTAVPETAPTSAETKELVESIRGAASGVEADTGADIAVTGTTALNIDISEAMADALLPYLTVVIGLAFLLLMVVFRSILVPIKAALGLPVVGGCRLRRPRGRLPVGLGCRSARHRADGAGHVADADPRHRDRVRARHGLRGLPVHAGAGGLRPRRVTGRGHRRRFPAQRTGGGRGGDHHDQRLRRVHRDPHADHPDDGCRSGLRRPLRRLRGADGDRTRGDGAARPPGLVAAA